MMPQPKPTNWPACRPTTPRFRISRETVPGRRRYVARSQHLSVNPHTVITDDPDELRAALGKHA
jgi:hypothetical protein